MKGPAPARGDNGGGNGGIGAQGRGGRGGSGGKQSSGSGTSGAAAHGGNAVCSGAAAGHGGASNRNGAAAEGFTVVFRSDIRLPVAAKPWFLSHDCDGLARVPRAVYGRQQDGSVWPYNVTLHLDPQKWYLTGLVPLLNDLDVHQGDRVRLTREPVAGAGPGAAAAADGMSVVVEVVAAGQQQQGQHRRRHIRTAVRIDPPLDPSDTYAGRLVVSGDRRFATEAKIQITKDAALCLVGKARTDEARAAATTNGGTTPKYLVTVYARRAGEHGPPVAFPDVALTPTCADRRGHLAWYLTGLGPLHQHLGLAPRSPVRLVRGVGQDGRVRLVVEPRGKGEGRGGGGGEGGPAERAAGNGAEEEDGVDGGGTSSEGSEPGSSSDDEEGRTGSGGVSCGGDSALAPGEGEQQGTRGTKRAQQRQPQPPPPPPQRPQQQQQPPPMPKRPPSLQQQPDTQQPAPQQPRSASESHQPQQPHPQNAQPLPQAPPPQQPKPWQQEQLQPQAQPPQQQQQQELTGGGGGGGGGGGDGAGPSGAVGLGAGRAGPGPGDGEQGRPGKRRRLEVGTEPEGVTAEGGEGAACINKLMRRGTDLLLAALEGSRAALAAAEARAAVLAADRTALEGQLQAERERAEAAEAQLGRERGKAEAAERERTRAAQELAAERAAAPERLAAERARADAAEAQLTGAWQHMAGVLQQAGVQVDGGEGEGRAPHTPAKPPQARQR